MGDGGRRGGRRRGDEPGDSEFGSLDEEWDDVRGAEVPRARGQHAAAPTPSVAKSTNTQIKSEILKLENLKLGDNNLQTTTAALNSDVYAKAKAEAEAASEKFGPRARGQGREAVFEVVSASDDAPVNMGSSRTNASTAPRPSAPVRSIVPFILVRI